MTKSFWPLFLLIVVFHVLAVPQYPAPFVDEGMTAANAQAYLEGSRLSMLEKGALDLVPGHEQIPSYFSPMVYATSSFFTGEITLFGVRAVNQFFGIILLLSLYSIGNSIGGRSFAAISTVITALSYQYAVGSHYARVDVIIAALGFLSIALHLSNTEQRWWIDLLVGLIIGVGFELHPRICVFGPVVGLLYLQRYGFSVIRSSRFWLFVFGGSLGLGLYFLLHVAPNVESFLAYKEAFYGDSRNPPVVGGFLGILVVSLPKVLTLIDPFYFLPRLFVVVELLLCATEFRNNDRSRFIAILAGGGILSYLVLVNPAINLNAILVAPYFSLVLASLALRVWHKPPRLLASRLLARGMVFGSLIASSLTTIHIIYNMNDRCVAEHREISEWMMEYVQPYNRLIGPASFWFALRNKEMRTWEVMPMRQRVEPGLSLKEALEALDPEIFITSQNIDLFLKDDDAPYSLGYGTIEMSKSEFQQILDQHATLLAEWDKTCYQPLRIYRMNFSDKAREKPEIMQIQ